MSNSDLIVLTLVTKLTRKDVVRSLIPFVNQALSLSGTCYRRLPVTREYLDWEVNDTGTLTVVLDEAGDSCLVLIATRNIAPVICHNVAAALCTDYDAHMVLADAASSVDAETFKSSGDPAIVELPQRKRIVPRRVRALHPYKTKRPSAEARIDQVAMRALRYYFQKLDLSDGELLEVEQRRAKTIPMRLLAWVFSFMAVVISAPLAIPVIIHNLVRGEDVRLSISSLAIAGMYALLAHNGAAPALAEIL